MLSFTWINSVLYKFSFHMTQMCMDIGNLSNRERIVGTRWLLNNNHLYYVVGGVVAIITLIRTCA